METAPTPAPSEIPVATLEFDRMTGLINEAAKFHFALKTIGILPGMLPHVFVERIRDEVNTLVLDEGGGRYRIDPEQVSSLRMLVQEKWRQVQVQ